MGITTPEGREDWEEPEAVGPREPLDTSVRVLPVVHTQAQFPKQKNGGDTVQSVQTSYATALRIRHACKAHTARV